MKINLSLVPRKYRKHVSILLDSYDTDYFSSWESFLLYNRIGSEDGWLQTNDKQYKALLWLIEITEAIGKLDGGDV